MAGGCGTCPQTCTCAISAGTNTTITGTGAVGDPYVVNSTDVVASTDSVLLSGDGTSGTPITASAQVSGEPGNRLSVRSSAQGNPGLYASAPVQGLLDANDLPIAPDGNGNVKISREVLEDGIKDSFPFLTYDDPNNHFLFTPSLSDGYVWATASGSAQWKSLLDLIPSSALSTGEETFPREYGLASEMQLVDSIVHLTLLTARRTETITRLTVLSGSTALSAATSLYFGVYSVGGTWAKVADTVDVKASALTATNTAYTISFQASFEKTAGSVYAVAVVQAGGTKAKVAGPAIRALTAADYKAHMNTSSGRLITNYSSATLPATIDPASLIETSDYVPLYAWLRPA